MTKSHTRDTLPKFNAREDAERLKYIGRSMSYNVDKETVWKHTLLEIAMRLETGGYVATASE